MTVEELREHDDLRKAELHRLDVVSRMEMLSMDESEALNEAATAMSLGVACACDAAAAKYMETSYRIEAYVWGVRYGRGESYVGARR